MSLIGQHLVRDDYDMDPCTWWILHAGFRDIRRQIIRGDES